MLRDADLRLSLRLLVFVWGYFFLSQAVPHALTAAYAAADWFGLDPQTPPISASLHRPTYAGIVSRSVP